MPLPRLATVPRGLLVLGLAAATLACLLLGFWATASFLDRSEALVRNDRIFESFIAKSDGLRLLGKGWSKPEDWGVWSEGPRAEVFWEQNEVPKSDVRVAIDARLYPFVASREQAVRVSLNGSEVAVITRNWEDGILGGIFYVPASLLLAQKPAQMVFDIARPTAPKEMGEGEDGRKLGFGLKSIALSYSVD